RPRWPGTSRPRSAITPCAARCAPSFSRRDALGAATATAGERRRPDSDEPGPDVDLRRQGPVHGALLRDDEKLLALLGAERPGQRDRGLDPIELAFLRLALGAVDRVDLRVTERDVDGPE